MANKKTNYNKMSEKPVKEEPVVEVTETADEPAKAKGPSINAVGVVANCERLNVRALPKKDAAIVSVINKGDKVEIIEGATTKDFYQVIYNQNSKGFCMKDFITIE